MKKNIYKNTRVVIRQKKGKRDYYLFENTKDEYQKATDWLAKGEGGLVATLEEIMKFATTHMINLARKSKNNKNDLS